MRIKTAASIVGLFTIYSLTIGMLLVLAAMIATTTWLRGVLIAIGQRLLAARERQEIARREMEMCSE